MKRKLLSTMLTATMLVGMLGGCGNGGSDDATPTPAPTNQPESTPTSAPKEDDPTPTPVPANDDDQQQPDDGNTNPLQSLLEIDTLENPNIVVDLYWNPDAFESAAIARYEEKYGAGTVTVNAIGWNKGIETMQNNMATGQVSSLIFTEGNACFPSYATKNYFQPITEYVQADMGSDFMDQASMDNFLYGDEYYVFTNAARTKPYLVSYYTPIFEDNALETPGELYAKGEWTWDKFLEYCDLLTVDTDGDGAIDQWGLGPRYKLQNFAYAAGIVGVIEGGNGFLQSNWEDERMLTYFDFITKLETIQARAKNEDGNVYNDGWLGIGAMYIEAINHEQLANRDEDGTITGRNEDTSFVPLPTLDGSKGMTPVWDCGYAIPNGSANPLGGAVLAAMILDEYAKGLKEQQKLYMTDEEMTLYYDCMANTIPQRKNDGLYEGVTMSYGESEAREGTPAATIVDTYKNVVKSEVQAYNEQLMEKIGQ